jgi:flagella basal body P-ring formation protein FlgA
MTPALFALAVAAVVAPSCRIMVIERHAGEFVSAQDTKTVPCARTIPPSRLRLDPVTQQAMARADLQPGEELGPVHFIDRPIVVPGDRVAVMARIGHAIVQRSATVLQSARRGERFFVRADDGAVFVAPAIGLHHE